VRRAAAGVALGLLLAARTALAGPPADATSFAARDLEGRWAAYRESPDPVAAWVAFSAARRDWDLLEWIALTARTPEALNALEEADAPAWIRCALWRLEGADSHADEQARALLLGRRRGEVLDWLERHPQAVRGPVTSVLDRLREDVPKDGRVDASRLLPPWTPATLLRDLDPRPPPAPAAARVERALLAWARSSLRTDPWVAKVAALLSHADPAVRRAAALVCAYLPPPRVPFEALERLLRDGRQPDDVRAAAAIGLSFSSEPQALLVLLHVAEDPEHPAATAALSRLGDLGDEFAAERLTKAGAPAREAARVEALGRIRARLAAEDPAGFASRVPAMLRRAAWADLSCDPYETDLVPFAVDRVKARAADPAVRAALDDLSAAGAAPDDRLGPRILEFVAAIRAGGAGKAK
jgi:hypothetical protein